MAIGIYFAPPAMTTDQYDEIIHRLEQAGATAPKGRLYHIAFFEADKLYVFDVWESREDFDAFGQVLMPIMAELQVDVGTPDFVPVHNIVKG